MRPSANHALRFSPAPSRGAAPTGLFVTGHWLRYERGYREAALIEVRHQCNFKRRNGVAGVRPLSRLASPNVR